MCRLFVLFTRVTLTVGRESGACLYGPDIVILFESLESCFWNSDFQLTQRTRKGGLRMTAVYVFLQAFETVCMKTVQYPGIVVSLLAQPTHQRIGVSGILHHGPTPRFLLVFFGVFLSFISNVHSVGLYRSINRSSNDFAF